MKICIAGMKHCGSTMVLNMIRIACRLQGFEINNKIDDDNFLHLPRDKKEMTIQSTLTPCDIRKSHEYLNYFEEQNYIIILPIRDIRDCAISNFMRFQKHTYLNPNDTQIDDRRLVIMAGLHTFLMQMHENIRLFQAWYEKKNLTRYIFHYEKYKQNPKEYISSFFHSLSFPSDEEFVERVLEETEMYPNRENLPQDLEAFMQNENKTYDILLTKDHNTSGGKIKKYESFFTPEQNNILLEDTFVYSFLQRWGYLDNSFVENIP